MPVYDEITYTGHARQRMEERRIRREDVEFTLRTGEGRPGRHDTWIVESGRYRVVITEDQGRAHVLTVVRLRGKR